MHEHLEIISAIGFGFGLAMTLVPGRPLSKIR